jgi:hypothetical protein
VYSLHRLLSKIYWLKNAVALKRDQLYDGTGGIGGIGGMGGTGGIAGTAGIGGTFGMGGSGPTPLCLSVYITAQLFVSLIQPSS